ncbi:MAG: hypothetical protein IPM59_07565 [Chloracidobacterium sp.]|nr:hypothetical protein [Chloracidobacterium sp.]
MKKAAIVFAIFTYLALSGAYAERCAFSQTPRQMKNDSPNELRNIFLTWLGAMKDSIKADYYDPKYRGIELDERFDVARNRIESLRYDWQMFQVLAELLMEFDDSHTSLIMPPRKDHFDYGFYMQIVGVRCLVTSVTKDSDAEKAGLEVGDQIIRVGAVEPDRDSLWKLFYVMHSLAPTETLGLIVRKESGSERELEIKAKRTSLKEHLAERKKRKDKEKSEPVKCVEINKEVIACKLYTFEAEKRDIDRMMKSVAGHSKLILDLRGNGGGSVAIEEYLTGYFFDRDLKMLDLILRKKTEARVAKSQKEKVFNGELIVLVDSRSASASEVFARVVQLEKRGKVAGDRTHGSVMTSAVIPLVRAEVRFGYRTKVFPLFMSLSIGDVVMTDGGRLEKKGVVPDIPLIPKGSAFRRKLDPVLAAAVKILGYELSPEDAGKMLFIKETTDDSGMIDISQAEDR